MTVEAGKAPPERLKLLPTRQRVTGAQAAQHSLLVRRLRVALPLLAVALIGVLLFNAREETTVGAFLDDFADADATPEELQMAKPRFAGVDDRGRPYEITADSARQASEETDEVLLVQPRAQTGAGADAEDTLVTARTGVYRKDANELDLSDSVQLEHDIGAETYVLTTPAAKVSIKGETVESVAGVEGRSKSGTLRADRMRAYNAEGRVVFEGNVSMRFDPKSATAPADETAGDGADASHSEGEPQ